MFELNSIWMRLQQDSTTLSDIGALFHTVTNYHFKTANRLNRDAIVVENPRFRNIIVKLQRSQLPDSSDNELQIIEHFQL